MTSDVVSASLRTADEAERTYGDVDDVGVAPKGGWNAQFVDGEWRSAAGRDTITVNAPATRSPVGEVPRGTTDDLDEAFAAAERAQEEWANTPPQARSRIVARVTSLLEEHAEDVAHLRAIEGGGVRAKAGFETGAAGGVAAHAAGMSLRNRGSSPTPPSRGRRTSSSRSRTGSSG